MRPLPILLVFLSFSLACMSGGGGASQAPTPAAPVYVPMPNMVIGDTTVTDACGGLFSDCARASCIVINSGDASGSANVEMTVTSKSGQQLSHGESLILDPGDRKTVSYDFQGFDAATIRCVTR